MPGNVPTTYPDPFGPMSQSGLGGQHVQVGAGSPTGVQLCRLSFRPLSRPGQTHAGEVDNSISENQISLGTRGLLGQAVHVPNLASDSHRKTSGIGTSSHAPYPVASKEALACPRNSREDYSPSRVSPCSPEVVVGPRQRSERSTVTPIATRPPAVYRCLKRRLGCTLSRLHCKRPLVQVRRRLAHKFARTQGSPAGPETVRAIVVEPVVSYINKEGSMKSGSLCALVCRLLLWCNQREIVLRASHIPGHLNVIADKLSRHKQVIKTEWSLLQEIFDLLCRRWHQPAVDLFATRFNHKLPRFVSPVPDKLAWKEDALSLPMEGPGHLCLSSNGSSGTGGHQTLGPRSSPTHYVHPLGGGGHIIFAFSAVWRPASHLVSRHFRQQFLSYLYQIWHAGLLD